MGEACWRCARGLLASLVLVLWPARLAHPPPAAAPDAVELPAAEAGPLALAPPDWVETALAVGLGPGLPEVGAGPPEAAFDPHLLDPGLVATEGTLVLAPEPDAAWLGLLSLAGAWVASRGRRRSPRSQPPR